MKVNRLEWDSSFFGIEIGSISSPIQSEVDALENENFDLIVLDQEVDNHLEIQGYENTFKEIKVLFTKNLAQQNSDKTNCHVFDSDVRKINADFLYPIAHEIGNYSRFKLDSNFTVEKFKLLYNRWVDNSLSKKFADKLYYIHESDDVLGFVTISKEKSDANIGLIGVKDMYRGRGFGARLLQKCEEYCLSENGISLLSIPTQKLNVGACSFYHKLGYTISQEKIIKHYWKK